MSEENPLNVFPTGIDPSPNYAAEIARRQLIKEVPKQEEPETINLEQTEEAVEESNEE